MLDASSVAMMSSLEDTIARVFSPALRAYREWGELNKTPEGKKTRNAFLEMCDSFVQCLRSRLQGGIENGTCA